MTKEEYENKRNNIMLSSAPMEVREQALANLQEKYGLTNAVDVALVQYEEAAPDISDFGE